MQEKIDWLEFLEILLYKLDSKTLESLGNFYDSWADKISALRKGVNDNWDNLGEKTLTDLKDGDESLVDELGAGNHLNDQGASEFTEHYPQMPDAEEMQVSQPDNMLDVKESGLKNWRDFENAVSNHLKTVNSGKNVGSQISLDVYYMDGGNQICKRVIADNLIENVDQFGVITYKYIDAKTSKIKDLVNLSDLSSVCTKNQKLIYPKINDGNFNKVVIRGDNAYKAFNIKDVEISLETGVDFYVNKNINNFSEYVVRSMIK